MAPNHCLSKGLGRKDVDPALQKQSNLQNQDCLVDLRGRSRETTRRLPDLRDVDMLRSMGRTCLRERKHGTHAGDTDGSGRNEGTRMQNKANLRRGNDRC